MDRRRGNWSAICPEYSPLAAGSIDGTDDEPHDRAIVRAMNAKYKPNKGVVGDPDSTVFVGRLHPKTTETTLQELFSKHGDIKCLRLVRDLVTGFSKCYAFIEYFERESARIAYRDANKFIIDDVEIFVDFEQERNLKGWVPRRLGGGLSGKKESGQLRFGGRDRPFKEPLMFNQDRDRNDRFQPRNSYKDNDKSRFQGSYRPDNRPRHRNYETGKDRRYDSNSRESNRRRDFSDYKKDRDRRDR